MAQDELAPLKGTITIRWKRLPDPYGQEGHEFDWEYVPEPPTPIS
jgi:hypothetical protein